MSGSIEADMTQAERLSIELASKSWQWRKRLLASEYTTGVKLAGIAIAEFVNHKSGKGWASQTAIAELCRMKVRTIRHAFSVLKDGGFFVLLKRKFRSSNEYALALPPEGVTGTSMPGSAKPKSARRRRKPASPSHSNRHDDANVTGIAMTPDTTTEPTSELNQQKEQIEQEESGIGDHETSSIDPEQEHTNMMPVRKGRDILFPYRQVASESEAEELILMILGGGDPDKGKSVVLQLPPNNFSGMRQCALEQRLDPMMILDACLEVNMDPREAGRCMNLL
jgi:hypothetical protein